MTASVPNIEPSEIRVGDTVKWRREDLSTDYPASTWTLKYQAKNPAFGFTITAAAEGDAFAVTVDAADSAAWQAGRYQWVAWVESGAEKYTLAAGAWTLLPDLRANDAASPYDARPHAQIVLDNIEAVIARKATSDQMSFQIAGRALSRTPWDDLLKLRNVYRAELRSLEAAKRLAAGLGSGAGVIQVRI